MRLLPSLVVGLIGCAAAVMVAQQPARDAPVATGTARLSGVVVTFDEAASPVRGATVTLSDVAGRTPQQTAETDEHGSFTFVGLPAGRYDVSAIKPAYLKTSYGALRPERTGTPVALTDDERVSITLKMWRGGVITGVLRDPKGHPLPNVPVSVRRFQLVNGARTIATATSGSATTDDRGIYRIFGLPPGEYAVVSTSAVGRGGGAAPPAHQVTDEEIQRALRGSGAGSAAGAAVTPPALPLAQTLGYAPVYFPGTAVALDAVPVHLDAGEERSGVDFAVQLVPVASVSGTIASPDGQTIASLQVSVMLTARSEPSGLVFTRSAGVTAGGTFTLGNVTPGQYTLMARATPPRSRPDDPPASIGWWASTNVSVNGQDLPGLSLTLEPGVTVSGRVAFEGAAPPAADAAGVSVRLAPAHGDQGAADVRTVTAASDRTFTIAGVVPGEYVLSASLIQRGTPIAGWTFKSASAGRRDMTDVPLTIGAGTSIDNVVVSFTDRPTEISGVFQDASGRPAPEYFVVAFPVNRALWAAGSRRIQQVRPATDGRFTIMGLPAGDYALAATTDVQPNDLLDPAFLEQLLAAPPIRISLKEGAKVTQDIRVVGKDGRGHAGVGMLMVLLSLGLHAQQTRVVLPAQPQAPAQKPTGTGAITGAVVDATTDRPVAGAMVTLEERVAGVRKGSYVQVTTPKGRFAFLDLPASESYFLTAAKAGYLDGGYGRTDPRGPSAPIVVKDDEWVGDLRATVSHPGSISGTIVDERGEPIVGATVRVLPQVLIAGRTQWIAGAVARTDDRGAYRIPGLGPGQYVVSVPSVQATLPASATIKPSGASAGTSLADLMAANEAAKAEKLLVDAGGGQQLVVGRYTVPPSGAPDGQRTAYPIAFYPSVATPADATPVELRVSEDRSGIDLQLQPVRTARVSGRVQGPPEAISNLLLRLIPVGLEELGQGSEAATTVTLADGRFTFLDVPSGSYVLDTRHTLLELTYTSMNEVPTALPAPVAFSARNASASGVRAAPPGVDYSSLRDWADVSYWGQLRVDLSGRDVDDLVLPLRRPATMSGQVVWAPDATSSSNSPHPMLEPADGRRSLGVLSVVGGPIGSASTFTIEGLMAGDYLLRTWDAAVQSITWEGQDYTERPFDASAGRDISGVVMTLTTASSHITGVVSDGNTALTSGAAVIAFPVERERWSNYGFNPTRLKSVLTTSDGRYRLDGLPMGEYYLLAVPASQERAWLDPAFLASHAGRASRVRVDRSDAKIPDFALSLVR